ncbi:MAG: hypothetical protein M3251_05655 [Thermoproteota archaeon]|nr:hypothetical protein [Thermoproteota archaeon]
MIDSKLPAGVQLVGRPFDEYAYLRLHTPVNIITTSYLSNQLVVLRNIFTYDIGKLVVNYLC